MNKGNLLFSKRTGKTEMEDRTRGGCRNEVTPMPRSRSLFVFEGYKCVLRLVLLHCIAAALTWGSTDHSQVLRPESVKQLARVVELEGQGEFREAERVLLHVLRSAESAGAELEQAFALNNLAVLHIASERYADAERKFIRARQILPKLSGEAPKQLLAKATLHLAFLYIETGRAGETQKLRLHELRDAMGTAEGRAQVERAIAGVALLRNRLDEAEGIFLRLVSFWREPSRVNGGPIEIATALNNLGVIAVMRGDLDTARERLEESAGMWRSIFGENNPRLARVLGNIGMAYIRAGQYQSAAVWLARASEIGMRTLGELHPLTVRVQLAQAKALKKAGHKAEANRIAKAATEAQKMMHSLSETDYSVDYRDLLSAREKALR